MKRFPFLVALFAATILAFVLPVQSATAQVSDIVVSGAGTTALNGTYTYYGQLNGANVYQMGSYFLSRRTDGDWILDTEQALADFQSMEMYCMPGFDPMMPPMCYPMPGPIIPQHTADYYKTTNASVDPLLGTWMTVQNGQAADPAPTLSAPSANPDVSLTVSATSVPEGGTFDIVATLSGTHMDDVAVVLAFDGFNTSDYSYSGQSQIIIPAGNVSNSLTVTVVDDNLADNGEMITVEMSSIRYDLSTLVTPMDTQQKTITFTDSDPHPVITLSAVADEVLESDNAARPTFKATLDVAYDEDISVSLNLSGTAIREQPGAGKGGVAVDYSGIGGILIPAGSLEGTTQGFLNNDLDLEGDETIIATFASSTPAGQVNPTANSATITIIDDETPPEVTLAIDKTSIVEGDSPSEDYATITATLPYARAENTIITLATTGTAIKGTDYNLGVIFIPAGSLTGSQSVFIIKDDVIEGDETIAITVAGVTSNVVYTGAQTFNVTIVDNDTFAGTVLEINYNGNTSGENFPLLEDGGQNTIFIRIPKASVNPVDVTLEIVGGVLPAGSSFILGEQLTQTIPAGNTAAGWNFQAQDDGLYTGTRTVSFNIASVDGVPFTVTPKTVSILDDELPPNITLSVNPLRIDEKLGQSEITVTSNSAIDDIIQVDLAFAGTASRQALRKGMADPADYQVAGSISIPAGQKTAKIVLTGLDDIAIEGDETVEVSIASVTGASNTAGPQTKTITITDDDFPQPVTLTVDKFKISEDVQEATFKATIPAAIGEDVVVTLSAAGTAVHGSVSKKSGTEDYVMDLGITILAGQTEGTSTMITFPDYMYEGDETAIISIASVTSNAVIAGGSQSETVTITDMDSPPLVSFPVPAKQSVAENIGDTTVRVSIDAESSKDVTFNLFFSGDLTYPDDFTFTGPGTSFIAGPPVGFGVTIPAGSRYVDLTLSFVDDAVDNADRTHVITMSQIAGATLSGSSTFTTTVQDDENAPVITLSASATSVSEGNTELGPTVELTASLSGKSASNVAVQLYYGESTATKEQNGAGKGAIGPVLPADFAGADAITIPAGETSATITLQIAGDLLDEPDETIVASLASPKGGAVISTDASLNTQTITITDDDAAPTVSLYTAKKGEDVEKQADEMDEQDGIAVIFAKLDAPSGQSVHIPVVFPEASGGAVTAVGVPECGLNKSCSTAAADYSYSANAIRIPAGETSGVIVLRSIDNDDYAGDRMAVVRISQAQPDPTFTVAGTPNNEVAIVIKEDEDVPFKAVDDEATTAEDSPVVIDVLANDNAGGVAATDILAIEKGTATLIGTAEIVRVDGQSPQIRYTPKADWNGVENFNYRSTDGNGNKDVQKVTVTVTPVNDAPVAKDHTVPAGTTEDATFTIPVANLATDVDQNDVLTVTFATAPTKGVATFKDGVVTVVPTKDANGADFFEFTVTDNGTPAATSEKKKVSWTLAPVFDAPTLVGDGVFEVERGRSVTLDMNTILTTVDGPTLRLIEIFGTLPTVIETFNAVPFGGVDTFSKSTVSGNAIVLGANQTTMTYTASGTFAGTESFSLRVLHTVEGDYAFADVSNPAKTFGEARIPITIKVIEPKTVVSLLSPDGAPAQYPIYRTDGGASSPNTRTYTLDAGSAVGVETTVVLESTGAAVLGTDFKITDMSGTETTTFKIASGSKRASFNVQALSTGESLCYGDVNGEGGLTTADLVLMQQYILNVITADALARPDLLDVNGDGKVSTLDLVDAQKVILGITPECRKFVPGDAVIGLSIKSVSPGTASTAAQLLAIPLLAGTAPTVEIADWKPASTSIHEGGPLTDGGAGTSLKWVGLRLANEATAGVDIPVTVSFSGATQGVDFEVRYHKNWVEGSVGVLSTASTFEIGTGLKEAWLEIRALDDAVYEGNETLSISIVSAVGADVTSSASGKSLAIQIVDNDLAGIVPYDDYVSIRMEAECPGCSFPNPLIGEVVIDPIDLMANDQQAGRSANTFQMTSLTVGTNRESNSLPDITITPEGSSYRVSVEVHWTTYFGQPVLNYRVVGTEGKATFPFTGTEAEKTLWYAANTDLWATGEVVLQPSSGSNRATVSVTQAGDYQNQPIQVESPQNTTLEAVQSTTNPSPKPLPAGVDSPVGFLKFNIKNIQNGTSRVEVTLPEGATVSEYWKYGPRKPADFMCPTGTAANAACEKEKEADWYKWNYDEAKGYGAKQETTPSGRKVLALYFKDGELGDFDLAANGVIIDPGVPVFTTNVAPVAVSDNAVVVEDNAVAINFLSNDTDADGDALVYSITTDPANGTWTDNGDGTGTYTPNADFFGTDSFTYTVDDGYANAEVGTVTIEVTGTPDLPIAIDDVSTTTNTTQAVVNVFGNDYDPDGDEPFYLSAISNPANGVASFDPSGTVTYTPNAGFVGQDTITYSITDGASGLFAQATVTITVTGALAGPVAADDATTTAEETAVSVAVLSNDVDPQGDALTVATFTQGANGTVTAGESGTLVYTPASDFVGTDSFTYTATDGTDTSSAVTVTVTVSAVNDAPVFAAGSAIVATDGPVWIGGELDPAMPDGTYEVAFDVTATDVDDDALTYTWQLASRTDFAEVLMSVEGIADGASVAWSDILDALVAIDMLPGDEVTLAQRVEVSDAAGLTATTEAQDLTFIRGLITANELGGELPTEYFLDGNYPNPFNPVTTIRFGLPAAGDVNVVVYDMMGRQVATLVAGTLSAGVHEVQFDASNLPSGAYIYRLATPAGQYVKTMMLLK